MAIYPSLYRAGLNSCHGNFVNRIEGTTEGFTGIALFEEKNGCFNASITKISSKGKSVFL
jgi:hypothetical protein